MRQRPLAMIALVAFTAFTVTACGSAATPEKTAGAASTKTTSASPASDASASPTDKVVGGMPAPLIRTADDLADAKIELKTGQVLVVTANEGQTWKGTGGTENESVATFKEARTENGASFNAGFSGKSAGETTAWVAGDTGARSTFTITVSE